MKHQPETDLDPTAYTAQELAELDADPELARLLTMPMQELLELVEGAPELVPDPDRGGRAWILGA